MKKSALAEKVLFFLDMIRLLLCLPIGLLLFRLKEIYIVCERGTDARDNGYHLFKYIVENHPEKNVYYIIDKRSADYPKVARLGKVIHYRSWKHVLFFVAARIKISSHYLGYAPGMPYRFQKLQRYLRLPGKYVFLQHGITQNDLIGLYAERAHIDLFVCGARPEYEFVSSRFGHPQGVVRYTGLARYDNLHGHPTKREILIMPTWRKYLSGMNKDEFTRSEYYSAWSELLNDSRLTSLLRENEIKLNVAEISAGLICLRNALLGQYRVVHFCFGKVCPAAEACIPLTLTVTYNIKLKLLYGSNIIHFKSPIN